MKKRKSIKKNNIIPFPNVDDRLMEKGLEAIHAKKYKEAIAFLEEAMSFKPENSEILIGLFLANFELGKWEQAKEIVKNMLDKGIGEYVHIMELYIMVLVQLHEYEEIVSTIEVLLEHKHIPANKLEHFSKMLQFSRKMRDSISPILNDPNEGKEEVFLKEMETALVDMDMQEQLFFISKLANQNIRAYIEDVTTYLSSMDGHPFLKTMILNILREQEYEKELIIHKFHRELTCVPAMLEPFNNHPFYLTIKKRVEEQLEQDNPTLLENMMELIDRHAFILYPFTFHRFKEGVWAAAYHSVMLEYFGQQGDTEEMVGTYHAEIQEIKEAKSIIYQLEEISYPNI